MRVLGRNEQRRQTIMRCFVNIGPSIAEEAHHLPMPLPGGDEQGSFALLRGLVLVSSCIAEEADHLQVTVLRSKVKRRCTVRFCNAFMSTALAKQPYNIQVAEVGHDAQGGPTIL